MKLVIFACVHNAGRSQMAAAFFRKHADPTRAESISAGTDPASRVHPVVAQSMLEVGIDLTNATPTKLTEATAAGATMLVTMGCGEQCPVVPGLRREDWPLEDPKERPIEAVRRIRDDTERRVKELLAREGWQKASSTRTT